MNDLRNGLYGTALVLAAAALGGCGQVANVRSLFRFQVRTIVETGKQLLLTTARRSVLDTLPHKHGAWRCTEPPEFAKPK